MTIDLVCIGHVLYDIRCYVEDFPAPDKLAVMMGRLKSSVGGSAANSAIQASKLGLKTGVIGKVGFDEYGWSVVQSFRNYNVNVDHILVDFKKPTGVSLITVNKEGIPTFVQMIGASEPVFSNEIRPRYIQDSQHLHMTGVNLGALVSASEIAKASGKTVSFDPGRKKSDLGHKRLLPVIEHVDVLFVNRREARVLSGANAATDIMTVIKRLRRAIGKEKTFVVKGGSSDILVYSPNAEFSVSSFNVKVVDTIGAGDAFAGGFLTAFLQGKDLEDAVIYGAACGSLKCMDEGAQSGPNKLELEEFLEENMSQAKITKLS